MVEKIQTIHREKSNGGKTGGTNLKVHRGTKICDYSTKIGGVGTKIGGAKVKLLLFNCIQLMVKQ